MKVGKKIIRDKLIGLLELIGTLAPADYTAGSNETYDLSLLVGNDFPPAKILDDLSLLIIGLLHDLEATRRENVNLRKVLQKKTEELEDHLDDADDASEEPSDDDVDEFPDDDYKVT